MSGYNIVIPDVCKLQAPEVTLPAMDAFQSLGHTPVTLAMTSISDMYQQMRYQRHGCYEIFQFYVRDLLRKGRIDFGFSVGLTIVLEDPAKGEAHHLLEECGIPSVLYLHSRGPAYADKLAEIGAQEWEHTFIACTSGGLAHELRQRGIPRVLQTWPSTCPRVFYPAAEPSVDAAYPLKTEDGRLAAGFDVSFVGTHSPIRERYIHTLLRQGVSVAVFGDGGWQESSVAESWRGRLQYLTDANTVYNASKISLDLPHDECQFADYISTRVFDCLATQSCLVTYEREALRQVLDPALDLVVCADESRLAEAVQYYLEHEDERLAVAGSGFNRVMQGHRWVHRLSLLLPQLEMHLLAPASA